MKKLLFLVCVFLGLSVASAVLADTVRIKTRPDAQITFDVSISGPTRISVVGDRIAKVLQSETNFEMVNDDGTGDVFLRFSGGQADPESGYIVTESGHTIGFVMTPKTRLETQTVLVTLVGSTNASALQPKPSGFAVNATRGSSAASPTAASTAPADRTSRLVQFTREAHAKRIGVRSPARLRRGVHSSYARGGLKARIAVASAVNGAPPTAAGFYRSKRVVSVWIDDVVQGGKVWVITVEGSL